MSIGDGGTELLLRRVLDGAAARHRALAANVANADTPGYKRRDVAFLQTLKNVLQQDDPAALRAAEWQPKADPNATVRQDGNSVSLTAELSEMAENRLLYQTAMIALRQRMNLLRTAIRGVR